MSKRTEREFFDHSFTTGARRRVWKYYALTRSSQDRYRQLLGEVADGARLLEYGCGTGSQSFALAPRCRQVVGIDISPEAIRLATRRARQEGLANCRFLVMDAERMSLPDASFDLICGSGILHHLDVDAAVAELARVLHPRGRAVFLEPLGHNLALNLFRRLTPSLRTPDEHPLVRRDLTRLRDRFGLVGIDFFHLVSFLSLPLLATPLFHRARIWLETVDRGLFAVAPALGPLAWYAVIRLERPLGPTGR